MMLVLAYMTGFLAPALLALCAARTSSLAGFMFVGNAIALPVHDPDNPIAHCRSGLHGRPPTAIDEHMAGIRRCLTDARH